jgi:hypothetical protein
MALLCCLDPACEQVTSLSLDHILMREGAVVQAAGGLPLPASLCVVLSWLFRA